MNTLVCMSNINRRTQKKVVKMLLVQAYYVLVTKEFLHPKMAIELSIT